MYGTSLVHARTVSERERFVVSHDGAGGIVWATSKPDDWKVGNSSTSDTLGSLVLPFAASGLGLVILGYGPKSCAC